MARLTQKQRTFIAAYCRNFNATRAAIDAGYSPDTAYSIGHENLKKPEIREEIRRHVDSLCQRFEATTANVLSELCAIAFSDVREVASVDEHGNVSVNPTLAWSDPASRAVAEVKQTQHGTSVKQHSKVQALKLLGDYLGLWGNATPPATVEFTLNISEDREPPPEIKKRLEERGRHGEGLAIDSTDCAQNCARQDTKRADLT